MTLKMFGVIASVSAAALTLSAGDAFAAGKGGGIGGGMGGGPVMRPGGPIGKPFGPGRGFGGGGFWPGGSFYYGGAPYSEPLVNSPLLPLTNDINYTYTYKQDVPWDWAHRYPPNVVPSDRPYVPSCSNEPVTVPGRSGDQTVNVMRCY